MTLLITGGGTGGHLAIAQALAEELSRRKKAEVAESIESIEVIYVGSINGQDRQWFGSGNLPADSHCDDLHKGKNSGDISAFSNPQYDKTSKPLFSATYFLETSGVVDKRGVAKILSLFHHLKTLKIIYHIFTKHDIKAVISVGGFSAAPASLGAIIFGKPLFIHEQNAIKGRLNAILSPFARRVFSAFGENRVAYPTKSQARAKARTRNKLQTIAFIGGSQGARTINHLAVSLAPLLLARGFRLIHQCGQKELESTKAKYEKLGIQCDKNDLDKPCQNSPQTSPKDSSANDFFAQDSKDFDEKSSANSIELFGFSKDIIAKLDSADICIGRAGASSVWESAALGLPMIYIPYPYAASNHQVHNAEFFAQKELGFVVLESKLESNDDTSKDELEKQLESKLKLMETQILSHIDFFVKSPKQLESISKSLIALAQENGAQIIVDEILGELG